MLPVLLKFRKNNPHKYVTYIDFAMYLVRMLRIFEVPNIL